MTQMDKIGRELFIEGQLNWHLHEYESALKCCRMMPFLITYYEFLFLATLNSALKYWLEEHHDGKEAMDAE